MSEDKPYRYNKEGKSPYVLIAVLLLLIVIVGGGLLYIISQRAPPPPEPTPNITNVTPPKPNITNVTPVCNDDCILADAVKNKNLTACRSISNESVEQDCIVQLSGSLLEACKLVSDPETRDSCLVAFAASLSDISLCDLVSSGKGECRNAVDPCLSSHTPDLCYALKLSDPSKCQSNVSCLVSYSMAKDDLSACDTIQNNVVSAACRSSALNSDQCSGLAKQAERDYCYELFAIYTDNKLTCTRVTPNSAYAVDCYSTFAIRERNYTVCHVFSVDERWACYINYSLATGDLSACEAIDELATTNRFKCAFEYAVKYGNPAACQVIEHLPSRDTCYQGAIIYSSGNLDWQYCDDVINFEWMNKCYNEAAKLYDDIAICDKIEANFAREACKTAYEVNKSK
jgi:hypothetical protein